MVDVSPFRMYSGPWQQVDQVLVMVSHCRPCFKMVGDDMAVVCDHYLFRNISSLPEYALAGKLLTEQGREPTINSTRVTFTWKASAIKLRHRSSQANKGLWELL